MAGSAVSGSKTVRFPVPGSVLGLPAIIVLLDGAGTPGYPKPWLSEKILGHRFFRNIVLS